MKIESFTDQGSGQMNEDDLLIKDGLFCVFDGVTSLVKYIDPNGITGGKLGSRHAKIVFDENSDKSLKEMALLANKRLRNEMLQRGVNISSKTDLWGTTVACIKIMGDEVEFMQVGDSFIIFIENDNKMTAIPNKLDIDHNTLVLAKQLVDEGVEDVKTDKRILDLQKETRKRVNVDYGTLNGEEEVNSFITTGKKSVTNIKHILLLTDGIKVLKEDPTEPEDFQVLVDIFLESGLNGLKAYVRKLENSDPNCRKYPRTKVHDDATGIAISF